MKRKFEFEAESDEDASNLEALPAKRRRLSIYVNEDNINDNVGQEIHLNFVVLKDPNLSIKNHIWYPWSW